jgi:hypothetical protein
VEQPFSSNDKATGSSHPAEIQIVDDESATDETRIKHGFQIACVRVSSMFIPWLNLALFREPTGSIHVVSRDAAGLSGG